MHERELFIKKRFFAGHKGNNPGTCGSKLGTIDGSNGTNSKNELGTL